MEIPKKKTQAKKSPEKQKDPEKVKVELIVGIRKENPTESTFIEVFERDPKKYKDMGFKDPDAFLAKMRELDVLVV